MRLLWLTALLFGCSSNGLPASSDLAGVDLARAADLARPPMDLAGVDLAGPPPGETCVSACNRCASGPCCGSICCNAGEWCDATNTCRCGNGAGCTSGLMCASGGPVPSGPQCGFICCGDQQHPCPL